MPYNGAGNFVSLPPPQYPAVPGDVIRAAYFNAVINDLIAGLTNVITRDGQSPPTSNLPMAGKRHTGISDATAVDQYSSYGQLLTVETLATFLQAGVGAVARSLRSKLRDVVSVKDFGAVGDGVADDTMNIVYALAYLSIIGGGTLMFPNGSYKTTAVIDLPPNVVLVGTGRRKAYPGVFVPGANTPATIVPTHTDRCCFRVYNTVLDANSNVAFRDINLATLGAAGSAGPTAAIGFECGSGLFQRDFTFERCGIHGFTSAFDTYLTAGANIEMGVIKIINCAINLNNWIARSLNGTQWNGFTFLYNEAGQNGYNPGGGGLAIAAFTAAVEYNILEGQRDPVYIFGAYKGVSVRANYFEANVGVACIQLKAMRGPWFVGPNTYLGLSDATLQHKVFLGTPCGMGQSTDPFWPELVYKTPLAVLGADAAVGDNVLNASVDAPYARVDRVVERNWSQVPSYLAAALQAVTLAQRELNPQTGMPMPVQEYTTAGAGVVSLSYTIAGAAGTWVVACWLMKLQPDASATPDPYISMSINGVGAAGSRDYPLSGFGTYFLAGEWALITTATKVGAAGMTSLLLNLYPHGLAPTAGRVSRFLRPVVYVVDNPNKILPYIDNITAQSCAPAPMVGTWNKGDILMNSLPAAGQGHFTCTASGTPGTWAYT